MSDDALTEFIQQAMPLCRTLGIRAVRLDGEQTILEMDWAEENCTAGGLMHGGAIMALADTAGASVAFANLPEGASGTSTIEANTNFLGAVRDGTVTATATVIHAGSQTIVVEADVHQADRLVTKTIQTQMVLR